MAFVEIINAKQAAQLINDEDFIAIQGSGGGVGEPTALIYALRERYLKEARPGNLTLCHATGIGDALSCDVRRRAVNWFVKAAS